ncbi:PepSY domain-containing protein [Acetobacter sp. AN02]|uniref:PepSY-associated TM helix domain-containing protein n=1 Tax=Acetobacter sp. AN02 TaxID=2894186 RepID=UPI002434428B|nr:PepSY-associated TM helix domain-containing protein [Acetobacter sp. AN02]MDG6094398.1 PepSY domain-containing protein [Acetobacter sp. AN02]
MSGPAPSFRIRLSWLHAWPGFIAGLFLICIFISGSLSEFDTEITRWMQPEFRPSAAPPSPAALDRAGVLLAEKTQGGRRGMISLPGPRDPALRVIYADRGERAEVILSPEDGHVVQVRETAGGMLFFAFHHHLNMGRVWGSNLTTALGVALVVILVSGLILQLKALLPELMLFRPGAQTRRAWLDGHLMLAVLALPFYILMAWTGSLIHAERFFPGVGAERPPAQMQEARSAPSRDMSGAGRHGHDGRRARAGEGGGHAPAASLASILADARGLMGETGPGRVQIARDRISVMQADGHLPGPGGLRLDYDRVSGARLKTPPAQDAMAQTRQTLSALHMGHWESLPVRWLYFLLGLAGAGMMAAGMTLFLIRRRQENRAVQSVPLRMGEALLMTSAGGMPLACLAVFWANRLIPAGMEGRAGMEGLVFNSVWTACLVYCLFRAFSGRTRRGWHDLMLLTGLAGLTLPVLDIATGGRLPVHGDFVFAAVDLTGFVCGAAALRLASFLRRKVGAVYPVMQERAA